jgi:hypothetical protein
MISVAVTFYTLIREVVRSIVARNTGYPEGFHGYPQSPQGSAVIVSRLDYDRFYPNSF